MKAHDLCGSMRKLSCDTKFVGYSENGNLSWNFVVIMGLVSHNYPSVLIMYIPLSRWRRIF